MVSREESTMTTADDVVSHSNKAATEASKASNAASSEVSNFLADIGELLKTKTSLAGIDVDSIKKQITTNYTSAKDTIVKTGGEVVGRAKQAAATTDEYVHEEPWKAIGIGVAFGFLMGALVSRR